MGRFALATIRARDYLREVQDGSQIREVEDGSHIKEVEDGSRLYELGLWLHLWMGRRKADQMEGGSRLA